MSKVLKVEFLKLNFIILFIYDFKYLHKYFTLILFKSYFNGLKFELFLILIPFQEKEEEPIKVESAVEESSPPMVSSFFLIKKKSIKTF